MFDLTLFIVEGELHPNSGCIALVWIGSCFIRCDKAGSGEMRFRERICVPIVERERRECTGCRDGQGGQSEGDRCRHSVGCRPTRGRARSAQNRLSVEQHGAKFGSRRVTPRNSTKSSRSTLSIVL
ncbi:unnamed protein product [Strongylus vulgaris]|uniref:Uncharacterized protein n=1 Tax=Strongylus vulgaris TaxID=40348 RepID=A0A3P7IZR5_STRVU|nr:unnamed protein product [Strongylus vulgaris]